MVTTLETPAISSSAQEAREPVWESLATVAEAAVRGGDLRPRDAGRERPDVCPQDALDGWLDGESSLSPCLLICVSLSCLLCVPHLCAGSISRDRERSCFLLCRLVVSPSSPLRTSSTYGLIRRLFDVRVFFPSASLFL